VWFINLDIVFQKRVEIKKTSTEQDNDDKEILQTWFHRFSLNETNRQKSSEEKKFWRGNVIKRNIVLKED